jgi:hypothetical protein
MRDRRLERLEKREERVDRLLGDAEGSDNAAMKAGMLGDMESRRRFINQRENYLAEANEVDPEHTCTAWKHSTVVPR